MAEGGYLELLSQAISVYVVSVCTVVKGPQILNIYRSNSTEALNMKSILMELWCFCTLLAYPCAQGYPLAAYLEFVLLVIQDLILLVLVLINRGQLTATNISLLVGFLSFVAVVAKGFIPSWALYGFIMTVTPLSASSKVLQIWTIYKK